MNGNQEDLKKETILILKSVILSKKDGVLLKDIGRDYVNEVGEEIPFRQFGYSSLENFIKSLGEELIVCKNRNNENVIRVIVGDKSKHIANLVREQKSPPKKKKRKRPKSAPPSREPFKFPVLKKSSFKNRSNTNLATETLPRSYYVPQKRSYETSSSSTDVRGFPFVVKTKSDVDNVEQKPKKPDAEIKAVRKKTEENKENLNRLRITVCDSKRRVEQVPKSVRFLESNLECSECNCPVVASGFTLFGDDFFCGYASEYLDYPVTITNNISSVGMCQKKLSLIEAQKMLHNRRHFPQKIVVLLGAIDILAGRSFDQIAYEYYILLNDLLPLINEIVVCTIPPLFSVKDKFNPFEVLLKTNALIRCIPKDTRDKVSVIDLYGKLTAHKNVLDFYKNNSETPMIFNESGLKFLNKILMERLTDHVK